MSRADVQISQSIFGLGAHTIHLAKLDLHDLIPSLYTSESSLPNILIVTGLESASLPVQIRLGEILTQRRVWREDGEVDLLPEGFLVIWVRDADDSERAPFGWSVHVALVRCPSG